MWKHHLDNIYNSIKDTVSKEKLLARISNFKCIPTSFSFNDVFNAVHRQHKSKAVGADGITVEVYMYGTQCLLEHITTVLNTCIIHNYMPFLLMASSLVPLVKNKNGNLCEIDNYKAIALSNSIINIFESVMLPTIMKHDDSDKYLFDFESGHSTAHCTKALKNDTNYYTGRGSCVFVCFIDFSKAFDKVNYWKLFSFLLDDNVRVNIISTSILV